MEIISVQQKQMKLEKETVKKKKVRWSMLLSHHPPQQFCRTYKIFGIRICARCLGIPIGIIIMLAFNIRMPLWLFFILPIPTFLNFLLQELKLIPSINWLKTFLTIMLGISIFEIYNSFKNGNLLFGVFIISYLFALEFIVAYILHKKDKLEDLIELYENNIYK